VAARCRRAAGSVAARCTAAVQVGQPRPQTPTPIVTSLHYVTPRLTERHGGTVENTNNSAARQPIHGRPWVRKGVGTTVAALASRVGASPGGVDSGAAGG